MLPSHYPAITYLLANIGLRVQKFNKEKSITYSPPGLGLCKVTSCHQLYLVSDPVVSQCPTVLSHNQSIMMICQLERLFRTKSLLDDVRI